MVLRVLGGMPKRKKDDDDDDDDEELPAGSIQNIGGLSLIKRDGDTAAVTRVIDIETIDIVNFVNSQSLADLNSLSSMCLKYKRHPIRDTTIRSYATFLDDMKVLEDFGYFSMELLF